MGWYSEISRDVGKIPDAVAHFESELLEAKKECKLTTFQSYCIVANKFQK